MNSSQQHRGRIQTHQRTTDDTVPIIGGSTELTNQQKAQIAETEGFHWKELTKRDYRNRIDTICRYLKDNDPEYFGAGVRKVADEDRKDPTLYFTNRVKYDLVYTGFNVTKLKLYLSTSIKWMTKKGKDDSPDRTVLASESTMRKYKDAVIMGSTLREEPLPSSFFDGMKHFMDSYAQEL